MLQYWGIRLIRVHFWVSWLWFFSILEGRSISQVHSDLKSVSFVISVYNVPLNIYLLEKTNWNELLPCVISGTICWISFRAQIIWLALFQLNLLHYQTFFIAKEILIVVGVGNSCNNFSIHLTTRFSEKQPSFVTGRNKKWIKTVIRRKKKAFKMSCPLSFLILVFILTQPQITTKHLYNSKCA